MDLGHSGRHTDLLMDSWGKRMQVPIHIGDKWCQMLLRRKEWSPARTPHKKSEQLLQSLCELLWLNKGFQSNFEWNIGLITCRTGGILEGNSKKSKVWQRNEKRGFVVFVCWVSNKTRLQERWRRRNPQNEYCACSVGSPGVEVHQQILNYSHCPRYLFKDLLSSFSYFCILPSDLYLAFLTAKAGTARYICCNWQR